MTTRRDPDAIRCSAELYRLVRDEASRQERSMVDCANEALRMWLNPAEGGGVPVQYKNIPRKLTHILNVGDESLIRGIVSIIEVLEAHVPRSRHRCPSVQESEGRVPERAST